MATWHQQRAGRVELPKKPTLITNPPGGTHTRMTFPSVALAKESLRMWQARGDRNTYLYVPEGWRED